MTVSDRIAQNRSDYFSREGPTRIDVHPEPKQGGDSTFFGKDGLTFRDVVDAINPLNHIPIISDLFTSATEHTPSTASRLVGGTLLGGPIGFVASLANVIFEEATGKSPAMAVYAAITDDNSTTQVVDAKPEALDEPVEMAELSPASPPPPSAALSVMSHSDNAPMSTKNKAILDLYGAGTSAHTSYRKVQMLPYLHDVSVSKVL